MADTFIQLNTDGTGKKLDTRTESTNSEHRQVFVIGDPSTNSGVAPVDATNGLAVDNKTLPPGAATAANQSTANTSLSSIDGKITAVNTGAVVVSSSALPSGAATAANQTTMNTTLTDGTQRSNEYSVELGTFSALTSLRDQMVAERYTVLSDSLADGLATFWTSTTANGGTATSTGGEGVVDTSANATGSAQLTSTSVAYYPGQSAWLNSAARFSDTGSAGNIRRIGAFTVSGTTPQEGFYFELSGTTLNAVIVKSGTPTATASTSWSRVATAPFTLDTSYHSFEIRFTSNRVDFYVDNVVRHTVSGTTSAITTTLNFPITIQSINTSGASSRSIAVRNIGMGRFGKPTTDISGRQVTVTAATSSGGYTPGKLISAASTNATSIKASAGTLGYITASNINAAARYLKIYNKASSPTVGTDVPVHTFLIPGNTAGAGTNILLPPQGISLSVGIAIAITTGVTDADTGAVAANEIVVNYGTN